MYERLFLILTIINVIFSSGSYADDKSFVLATTTSTENAGLLDTIIPKFTAKTDIRIDVIAIGTGQALAMGRRGDAAALLTHDRMGEKQLVANGHGADRRDVMFNDFVIIGPKHDPAGLRASKSTNEAFKTLAQTKTIFISRGDDSGTHRKERRLWKEAGFDPSTFGQWYREAGSGMGQTIITTTEMGGYTLSDRATWVKFARKADYEIVFESDPPLHNPYSSIIITHNAVPADQAHYAKVWHEWITGDEGQTSIAEFKVEDQQLFFTMTARKTN